MTVKMNGAQLKAFYASPIPSDQWFEDEEITVDGVPIPKDASVEGIPDSAKVTIKGGCVYNDPGERSVESMARTWLTMQTTAYLTIAVDLKKTTADNVKSILSVTPGVKVLK